MGSGDARLLVLGYSEDTLFYLQYKGVWNDGYTQSEVFLYMFLLVCRVIVWAWTTRVYVISIRLRLPLPLSLLLPRLTRQ